MNKSYHSFIQHFYRSTLFNFQIVKVFTVQHDLAVAAFYNISIVEPCNYAVLFLVLDICLGEKKRKREREREREEEREKERKKRDRQKEIVRLCMYIHTTFEKKELKIIIFSFVIGHYTRSCNLNWL